MQFSTKSILAVAVILLSVAALQPATAMPSYEVEKTDVYEPTGDQPTNYGDQGGNSPGPGEPQGGEQGGSYPDNGGSKPGQDSYPENGGSKPGQDSYPEDGGSNPDNGGSYPDNGGSYPDNGGSYPDNGQNTTQPGGDQTYPGDDTYGGKDPSDCDESVKVPETGYEQGGEKSGNGGYPTGDCQALVNVYTKIQHWCKSNQDVCVRMFKEITNLPLPAGSEQIDGSTPYNGNPTQPGDNYAGAPTDTGYGNEPTPPTNPGGDQPICPAVVPESTCQCKPNEVCQTTPATPTSCPQAQCVPKPGGVENGGDTQKDAYPETTPGNEPVPAGDTQNGGYPETTPGNEPVPAGDTQNGGYPETTPGNEPVPAGDTQKDAYPEDGGEKGDEKSAY